MTNKEKITKKAVELLEQKREGIKLFSHKSYIVVPETAQEEDISRLDSLCMIFGIGPIVFDSKTPRDPRFKILTRAARHEPDMFYVNKHVREVADELLS